MTRDDILAYLDTHYPEVAQAVRDNVPARGKAAPTDPARKAAYQPVAEANDQVRACKVALRAAHEARDAARLATGMWQDAIEVAHCLARLQKAQREASATLAAYRQAYPM